MNPYTRDAAEADLAEATDRGDPGAALAAADALDRMPPPPQPVLARTALWYAEHGLPVFPLTPLSKQPLRGTHGLHEATTDPDQVRRWWSPRPDLNIGLATGHGFDVIDFDGLRGHAAWGRRFPEAESFARCGVQVRGTVSTPRPGGMHVYVPSDGSGNRTGMLPGVDYRGRGGYVVAPPSVLDDRDDQHPGSYRWLRPLEEVPTSAACIECGNDDPAEGYDRCSDCLEASS